MNSCIIPATDFSTRPDANKGLPAWQRAVATAHLHPFARAWLMPANRIKKMDEK